MYPSFTLSPFHPFTLSPFHPFTLSPFHPFTLSPFHPFTLSPFHPFTLSPFHPFTSSSITRIDRPTNRLAIGLAGVNHWNAFAHFAVRARDDVGGDDFADFARGGSTRFDGGFDCADFAAHDGGDESGIYFFIADQCDL